MRLNELLREMKIELDRIRAKHGKKIRAKHCIDNAKHCVDDMEDSIKKLEDSIKKLEDSIEKLERNIVSIWNWTD